MTFWVYLSAPKGREELLSHPSKRSILEMQLRKFQKRSKETVKQ